MFPAFQKARQRACQRWLSDAFGLRTVLGTTQTLPRSPASFSVGVRLLVTVVRIFASNPLRFFLHVESHHGVAVLVLENNVDRLSAGRH